MHSPNPYYNSIYKNKKEYNMQKPLRKNDIKTLTPVEACLQRPGMYVGNIYEETSPIYYYLNNKIILGDIQHIPGLIKIFSELVDNSTDEAVRTNFQYATKIKIEYNEINGEVSVEDDGRGLPIELDENNKWIPELIFTTLHSGSNFNDDDPNKKQTIGMNGVGAALTAIYSKRFNIETANGCKSFKQLIENHTQIKNKPKIKKSKDNYTKITYIPNYDYFKLSEEGKKILGLLYYKRIKDLSFCFPEIQFTFNKEKLNSTKLKNFVESIHNIYEINEIDSNRIALFYSDTEFQQMSFVNSAYTKRGGTHVEYTINKIIDYVRTFLKKKYKLEVKPIDIKSKLFLLLSIRMDKPVFDTQSKESLISPNNFKDLIDSLLTKKFLDSVVKNEEIILPIVEAYKLKQQVKDNIELKKMNQSKKKIRIEKYYPAIKQQKYLLLCEGDSAAGGIQAALGRDLYSYFALKGKPLNALEADMKKIRDNDEFKNVTTILNLDLSTDKQDMTHNMIVCAQDADLDGQHIMALLLAFFKRFTPSLIKQGKIGYLRTPLFFAKKKNKIVHYFFTMEEFKTWEAKNPEHGLHFNYVKGLGTWEAEDLKYLFKEFGIEHFIKPFEYDEDSFQLIDNWMSGKTVDYRKNVLRGREFNIDTI
jgi:DNA gyrase/topoisomerase IV subunit B